MTHDTDQDLNLIEMLIAQHRQLRCLLDELGGTGSDARLDTFPRLVRLLSVHETAEEVVLYPVVRANLDQGRELAARLIGEERLLKARLADLEETDFATPAFHVRLPSFTSAVLAHIEHEEVDILPALRASRDGTTLGGLATALSAAEAIGPTHGHRRTPDNPLSTVLWAAPASLVDRLRDAVTHRRHADGHRERLRRR
jgi:hemerythrin superfamily protein